MRAFLGCLFALFISCAQAQVTPGTSPLTIPKGGTGASTAPGALTSLGAAPNLYTAPYTSAVAETQSAYNAQRVSINDFGGVGDGATNNDTAFTRAMGQTPPIAVYIPCGTYNVSNSIMITQANTEIFGQGMGCSIIRSTSANNAVIHANTSLTTVQIHDLTIDRTTTATSGGDGIDYSLVGDKTMLANLYVQHQFNGIDIGNTGFSFVNNITTINNVNNGFVGTNGASGAIGLQWQLDNIISQANGANGFLFTCNGTGSMSLGQHKGLASFSNTLTGLTYQGSSTCAINGVRLIDSFFGGDTTNEVVLDTHGTFPNIITHTTVEANSSGDCIKVTANNPAVSIVNSTANACALNGLNALGPQVSVIGGNYTNNGQLGTSGQQAGIVAGSATSLIAHGVHASNIGAGTTQKIGVSLLSGATNSVVSGNDLSNNATSAYSDASGLATNWAALNIGVQNGQLPGTATNDSASASKVGEFISSSVAVGSAVSLTTATPVNVTSISLTAGDWEVEFIPTFGGATTTVPLNWYGSISTTTATLNTTVGNYTAMIGSGQTYNNTSFGVTVPVGPLRVSLSATTTIFGVAQSTFSTSTSNAYGILRARRVR